MDLFIEMDNVLFEYNEQGRRRLKVINDVTDEAHYIEKLYRLYRKYLRTFPEEKDIKRDISMIYEILCKEVEKRDTPFGNEIIEAKKEIRDVFYDGKYDVMEVITKHNEIIEKYSKVIQSRITSIDQDPHIGLILELYYRSLLFSYRSLRTTNNSRLNSRLSVFRKVKVQDNSANAEQDSLMPGQGLSAKDRKALMEGQGLSTKERKELAEQAAAALMRGKGLSAKDRNVLEALVLGQDLSAKDRNALEARLASTSI